MKRLLLLLIVVGGLILGTDMDLKAQSAAKEEMRVAKAPLFRDPIHDGAADPMVIYNEQEKAWYMFYTNRRANVPTQGTNWCYGTRIGVAVSTDHGKNWNYVGALDLEFERGRNTFWAPHVVYDKGVYHLFVTYIRGVHESWSGIGKIAHYSSRNLWNWDFCGLIPLADADPLLDATVYKKPDGKWGMWYKNSRIGYTVEAVSDDLYHWTNVPGITIGDVPHEAPFVFYYKEYYWMLIDQWNGFGVYRSKDAEKWEKQSVILGSRGERKDDNVRASHPGVVVTGDKAYVFYFTHPGWEKEGGWGDETGKLYEAGVLPYIYRRSSIQVAELKVDRNGIMGSDRNAPFDFYLPDGLN